MSEELNDPKVSPMMIQWHACKKAAGDALLFFRMGDFYEAFYEDAITIAREIELTLTKRQGIPMCGVPYHTSEGYVDKLVGKGFRIAIAEQMEDPRQTKGLVKREVVRVVTPGSLINSNLLSEKNNNFIAAISRVGQIFGIAVLDITTGDFRVLEVENEHDLLNQIYHIQPTEIVISQRFNEKHSSIFVDLKKSYAFLLSFHDEWHFDHQVAYDFLTTHFGVKTLDGFGLKGMLAGINSAGALLSYLQDSLSLSIEHINEIHLHVISEFMSIDRATQRHLELTESIDRNSIQNTLLSVVDMTCTPMGARLIRKWLKQPLMDKDKILYRQDAVEILYLNQLVLNEISNYLKSVRDLERLMMKICSGYASPRDLVALKNSLNEIPRLKLLLQEVATVSKLIDTNENILQALPEMTELIEKALFDEPSIRLTDGKVFRPGYCRELDELREISSDGKSWIARYQMELRESTSIKTLKVGFNKMFGYYIEVSKGQSERVPEGFQRRQTLVNAERFITPELKNYESKVMHAEERIQTIENDLFLALCLEVSKYGKIVQEVAQAISEIDVIHSLARIAKKYDYVRPQVDNGLVLEIVGGRHPVIEVSQISERFIPNDTFLDNQGNRLILITGPNMAGKSTYIRQVALIVIMAQIGSFVPATKAHIGVVDKVFSRIGASDDLSRGQSTFMVEMIETANILNNATSRSLVILDEIGRGTSTYDGISIAWAVAEYLLTTEGRASKTLFATHYWELTKLEEKVYGAVNYTVAVHEDKDSVIFLRKIIKGGTDKSYGIHVGRLAGLPKAVINRAQEILIHLEENANRRNAFEPVPLKPGGSRAKNRVTIDDRQLSFFG